MSRNSESAHNVCNMQYNNFICLLYTLFITEKSINYGNIIYGILKRKKLFKKFKNSENSYINTDCMYIYRFNVAELGAMSRDTPYMSKVLVERMKNDRNVDIKNHWKVISFTKNTFSIILFNESF